MQSMDGSDLGAVLAAVTKAADQAIDETRGLIAHRGRASQVGARSANTPDPGICGVATILYDWCKHYGVDYTPVAAELKR
jgi:dihydroxyacetone kinase/dihydroxyacetone kinase-like protein